VWLAQVFTGAKTCDVNPILGDPGLNRRGLHVWRGRLAHRMARRRRERLAGLVCEDDRRDFERNGLIVKPGFVPEALFARLLAELEDFRGEAVDTAEGDAVNRLMALTDAALSSLPACREIVRSPAFQGLLRYVSSHDAAPRLHLQTIFSKAVKAKRDHQTRLHMDTFHPTMKAWLFLHDVGEGEGPFTYVPGSHRRTPRRDAWERRMSVEASDPRTPSVGGSFRIDPRELKRLGFAGPSAVAVRANTLVVADTYGFHARGVSASPSVRIAIYATSRPNPFLPWTSLGAASGRIAAVLSRLRPRAAPSAVSPASPPAVEGPARAA
jgi:hypothetical protein